MNRRPRGFTVLAVCAALFALALLALLAIFGDVAAVRVVLTVWCVPALLAADALWGARRWAYHAVRMLAACFLGSFLLLALGIGVISGNWGEAFIIAVIAGLTAFGVYPIVAYVRDRSRALHPVRTP